MCGSVVQLLQRGTVSQSYSYNAYGYINTDAYGIHEPFYGYNGEEQDPFTGLQYLRARYYAPQNGGFITQDSFAGILTNALSQNRYTYAENDPVNGIDPSGHAKVSRNGAKNGGSSKTNTAGRLSQSSKAPASTAAGKQQSPAKKPYTAAPTPPKPAPNYQKPTTYSSGAAKAAQSAKTASAPSSPAADFMLQTVSDPCLALREATGQWQAVPASVTQRVEAAKAHVRRTCDPNAGRVSGVTRSEAGWKIVDGTIRMFIGGAEVAAAVSVPSPLSVPTAIVGAGNVAYGFSDVFEGISVLTGNGSINFGRDLLFDGDQKKWDAAGAVLDISGFALTGASTGWGKAAKAGMTSAPEVLRSIATQLGKMYLSASVASTAGSYVEGAVTDVAGENWGRGAGLVTRFAAGLTVYGYLDALDQNWNFSGVYGVEGIDPSVQSAANTGGGGTPNTSAPSSSQPQGPTYVEGGGHAGAKHAQAINVKMADMAQSGDYAHIYGNRQLTTAGLNGTQRPDIIGIRWDGTVDLIEYASPSQTSGAQIYALNNKLLNIKNSNLGISIKTTLYRWGTY